MFDFKLSFRSVNKIKFSSLKDPISIENRSGISCNLGYIGQARGWLQGSLDEHHCKVENEEIYASIIASHCWS